MASTDALDTLPKATCYRDHTPGDAHRGVFGAVWLADVRRTLDAERAALTVAVKALYGISEMSDATEQSSFREEAWAALDAIPEDIRSRILESSDD